MDLFLQFPLPSPGLHDVEFKHSETFPLPYLNLHFFQDEGLKSVLFLTG